MAQFYAAVMTNGGAALLTQAIAGNAKIQFTTLVAGEGEYSEADRTVTALQKMTSLKSQKQSVGFSSVVVESETSVHLTGALDNEELVEGYYVREVGIYAKNALDDEAEPVLYSITVAQAADYMPPYNGFTPTTIIQEYFATVDNSAEITLEAGSGAYALAEDLNALVEDLKLAMQKLNKQLSISKAVLPAGETTVTISDTRITTDSVLSFFTSIFSVNPTAVSVANGSVTLTFKAQTVAMEVGVRVDG